MGIPNISRCKNRPNMFITTARPRITNKSSNSMYRKVTFVARFLGTGVTVTAMSPSPLLFRQLASR